MNQPNPFPTMQDTRIQLVKEEQGATGIDEFNEDIQKGHSHLSENAGNLLPSGVQTSPLVKAEEADPVSPTNDEQQQDCVEQEVPNEITTQNAPQGMSKTCDSPQMSPKFMPGQNSGDVASGSDKPSGTAGHESSCGSLEDGSLEDIIQELRRDTSTAPLASALSGLHNAVLCLESLSRVMETFAHEIRAFQMEQRRLEQLRPQTPPSMMPSTADDKIKIKWHSVKSGGQAPKDTTHDSSWENSQSSSSESQTQKFHEEFDKETDKCGSRESPRQNVKCPSMESEANHSPMDHIEETSESVKLKVPTNKITTQNAPQETSNASEAPQMNPDSTTTNGQIERGVKRKLDDIKGSDLLQKIRAHLFIPRHPNRNLSFAISLAHCLIPGIDDLQAAAFGVELQRKCGLSDQVSVSLADVLKFEVVLNRKIEVFRPANSGKGFDKCATKFKRTEDQSLYLYLEQNQYYGISSITGFFGRKDFCEHCFYVPKNHVCPIPCPVCKDPACVEEEEQIVCADCHRKCRSRYCFSVHKKNKMPYKVGKFTMECDGRKRCQECGYIYFAVRERHSCFGFLRREFERKQQAKQ